MLRFFDGFETKSYATWTTHSIGGGGPSISSQGRFGGSALSIYSATVSNVVGSQSCWTVGFALQSSNQSTQGAFMVLVDGSTTQIQLEFSTSGSTLLVRNGNGTILGTVATSGDLNVWHYYELQVVFSATVGSVILKRDGATLLTLTNVNTISSANASADTLSFTTGFGCTVLVDDIYMCDTSETINNTFLGDCRVTLWVPTQDGAHKDFTPSAGTSHYAMVDDMPSDGDATYVSSGTVGAIDTYRAPMATFAGTVKGLRVGITARKDDAGDRSVGIVIGDGVDPVTQIGGNIALTTVYTRQTTPIMEINPLTGSPWTLADIQADEFGLEVTV